jgi:hypothetical protein
VKEQVDERPEYGTDEEGRECGIRGVGVGVGKDAGYSDAIIQPKGWIPSVRQRQFEKAMAMLNRKGKARILPALTAAGDNSA